MLIRPFMGEAWDNELEWLAERLEGWSNSMDARGFVKEGFRQGEFFRYVGGRNEEFEFEV